MTHSSHAPTRRITNGPVHRIDLWCNLYRMTISIDIDQSARAELYWLRLACVCVCVCAVAKVGDQFVFWARYRYTVGSPSIWPPNFDRYGSRIYGPDHPSTWNWSLATGVTDWWIVYALFLGGASWEARSGSQQTWPNLGHGCAFVTVVPFVFQFWLRLWVFGFDFALVGFGFDYTFGFRLWLHHWVLTSPLGTVFPYFPASPAAPSYADYVSAFLFTCDVFWFSMTRDFLIGAGRGRWHFYQQYLFTWDLVTMRLWYWRAVAERPSRQITNRWNHVFSISNLLSKNAWWWAFKVDKEPFAGKLQRINLLVVVAKNDENNEGCDDQSVGALPE